MSPPEDELIMLNVELIILKVSPFGWMRHEAMDPWPPFMLLNTESFIVKSYEESLTVTFYLMNNLKIDG